MVPGGGIEPPTRGFSIHCSTPELPGHGRADGPLGQRFSRRLVAGCPVNFVGMAVHLRTHGFGANLQSGTAARQRKTRRNSIQKSSRDGCGRQTEPKHAHGRKVRNGPLSSRTIVSAGPMGNADITNGSCPGTIRSGAELNRSSMPNPASISSRSTTIGNGLRAQRFS